MDPTLIKLAVLVGVAGLLLAIGTIYSAVHWAAKALMVVLVAAALIAAYLLFQANLGFPLRVGETPERFIFAGGHVREPLPAKADPGAIYMMVLERGETVPRTIELPYSREAHKKVLKAKKDSAEGKTVFMQRGASETGEKGTHAGGRGTGRGQGKESTGRGSGSSNTAGGDGPGGSSNLGAKAMGDFDFVPPPNTVPDKDQPSLIGE